FLAVLEVGKPAVEAQPQLQIAHVRLGDENSRSQRDLRAPLLLRLGKIAAFERGDRLLQHRLVQLEADFADVARLLLAQQVAGAANIEVVAGEREARAQRIQ